MSEWKEKLLAEHAARQSEIEAQAEAERVRNLQMEGQRLVETLTTLGVPADPARVVPAEDGEHARVIVDDVIFLSDWRFGPAVVIERACPDCGATLHSDSIQNRGDLAILIAHFQPAFAHRCTAVTMASAPDPATIRQDCTPAEARLLVALKDWLADES